MTMRTIWLVGSAGKMGTELLKHLKNNTDYKVIGTDTDVDITDLAAVEQAVDIYRPAVIINCAGISNPVECEKDMVAAFKVNALGARNLAVAARRVNAKIIQISTDDVFGGQVTEKLTEFDNPSPTTVYGKSKLAGENYVRELNTKHVIIRSSWVYGLGKDDYLTYVLEKAKNNEKFDAPLDNISSPTSVYQVASVIVNLLDKAEYGIFHTSSEGMCTRYEFAKTILEICGYDTDLVHGAVTEGQTGQKSTILENLMLKMTDIYQMPTWKEDLALYVEYNIK